MKRVTRRQVFAHGKRAAVVAAVGLLAACSSSQPTKSAGTSQAGQQPASAIVKAAETAALAAAGGKKIGGSLTMVDADSGAEGQIIQSAIAPFEQATGIKVNFTGTSDASTIVATRVQAGNPPDIYDAANGGTLTTYAEAGKLVPLNSFMDMKTLESQFPPALLQAATVGGKLYGIWDEMDSYMIWYNPQTYKGPTTPTTWAELASWAQSEANTGTTPWCMDMQQGAATGVVGAHVVANLLLTQSGPEAVNQLDEGKLSWTSPEVKSAFELFGAFATSSKLLYGGPLTALSTETTQNGTGLFTSPPQCYLMPWGEYALQQMLAATPSAKAGTNVNFFPYPPVNRKYAGSQLVSGHVMYAFRDTPQVQAFLRYFATPQAQAFLAASGEWTVANLDVPLSAYPNAVMADAAKALKSSQNITLSPVATLPGAVALAFYKAVVSYMDNPSSLNSVLAGLEATAKSS